MRLIRAERQSSEKDQAGHESHALAWEQDPLFGVEDTVMIDRLMADFGATSTLNSIVSVVRQCRSDLCCAPESALPELVERLARVRLSADSHPSPVSIVPPENG